MKTTPLDAITLRRGAHDSRDKGVCLMEAVAWFAGERHSDAPACACPVLAGFGRGVNDCLPDDKRIRLLQYVPRLVGTADDGHMQARGLMAMDWIVRTYTPAWCALAGIDVTDLRALPHLRSWDDVEAAQPMLERVRGEAAAAWAAARDAARDAAWDAARDAAGAAAWAAARDAARDAVAPTRDGLQNDAIRLFGEMIELGAEDRALVRLTVRDVELVG